MSSNFCSHSPAFSQLWMCTVCVCVYLLVCVCGKFLWKHHQIHTLNFLLSIDGSVRLGSAHNKKLDFIWSFSCSFSFHNLSQPTPGTHFNSIIMLWYFPWSPLLIPLSFSLSLHEHMGCLFCLSVCLSLAIADSIAVVIVSRRAALSMQTRSGSAQSYSHIQGQDMEADINPQPVACSACPSPCPALLCLHT